MNRSYPSPSPPPTRRFQFRMSTLLMVMALISVPAALFGGFFRSGADGDYKTRLVLLTLMAPVGLVVLLGCIRLLTASRKHRRKW